MEIHASLFRNGCNQAVRIPRGAKAVDGAH